MTELRSILDEAERDGLLPTDAKERLLPFLVERGVIVETSGPARPVGETVSAWSDTETPRFVRGFHDVLITIGVIIVLSGLWGLASIYVVLPAIVILAEILVKRQRLALPAVSLTIALFIWIAVFMSQREPDSVQFWQSGQGAVQFVSAFPIVLGLFYLRYRVPLAFALCAMSGLGVLVTLFFRTLQWASGNPHILVDKPGIVSAVFVLCAIGLFAVAMYFDLGDRRRMTTRSDIAFWLHLGAAPALLYSVIALFSRDGNEIDLIQTVSFRTPVVIVTVAILMLIGLVIDRRAFVTSGLLSLGYAIYGIFGQGSATVDTYIFTTLLVVGIIVLIIGTGWALLRRLVMRALSSAVAERLPPA
ncbi:MULTISPECIES: hypothetical protein [unclassified Sinorhizobium]|uniref:hypothetical protein n=1 Tax=unclassified Sinorhizobium TaxID=2613772 RepID=UPI003523A093